MLASGEQQDQYESRYSSVGHYYDMMYHFRCVLITRPAKNKNGRCLEYCKRSIISLRLAFLSSTHRPWHARCTVPTDTWYVDAQWSLINILLAFQPRHNLWLLHRRCSFYFFQKFLATITYFPTLNKPKESQSMQPVYELQWMEYKIGPLPVYI